MAGGGPLAVKMEHDPTIKPWNAIAGTIGGSVVFFMRQIGNETWRKGMRVWFTGGVQSQKRWTILGTEKKITVTAIGRKLNGKTDDEGRPERRDGDIRYNESRKECGRETWREKCAWAFRNKRAVYPEKRVRTMSPRFSDERAVLHLKRENTSRFSGTEGEGGIWNECLLWKKDKIIFIKKKNSCDVREERNEKPWAVRRHDIYFRRSGRIFGTVFVFVFSKRDGRK